MMFAPNDLWVNSRPSRGGRCRSSGRLVPGDPARAGREHGPSDQHAFGQGRVRVRRGFARLLDLPFGRQEVSINIASAAALYKKLVASTEGYVGEVPIIHQAVAVKAAIDAMDASMAEDRDASF